MEERLFDKLQKIRQRPEPFERYTRLELWNDEHISKGMLEAHLNPETDAASRNKRFMDKSITWILSHFNIDTTSTIIDFGCGPGLYTTPFAEAGATVTGVDFSERSIHYAEHVAREKGLSIEYVLQDYLTFSTERRFDLITLIWCDFSALSPKQRAGLLGTFRTLLADDGAILLDVDSLVRFHKTTEKSTEYRFSPTAGFMSPVPHHVFTTEYKYEHQHVLLNKETIIEKHRELEILHWAQCYSLQTLKKEFADNGLQIVESYSDVAGTPLTEDSWVIAVVAKRAT